MASLQTRYGVNDTTAFFARFLSALIDEDRFEAYGEQAPEVRSALLDALNDDQDWREEAPASFADCDWEFIASLVSENPP